MDTLLNLRSAAKNLLQIIRKWRLEEGLMPPLSDAASCAHSEILGASSALESALGKLGQMPPQKPTMSLLYRDGIQLPPDEMRDADGAWSIIFSVWWELIQAGFYGHSYGDPVPTKVDASIVKRLEHGIQLLERFEPQETPPAAEQPTEKITWQDAATRLECLRKQGEAWSSYGTLAKQFGCSSGTLHKAVEKTPSLQAWASYNQSKPAVPRAQSFNEILSDRTAQNRELAPEDEAAISEYLNREGITPEERAFFNGLTPRDQIDFLDDPDSHQTDKGRVLNQQILGRKP